MLIVSMEHLHYCLLLITSSLSLLCMLDVDECNEGMYNCPRSTTCKNTEGSYECECPDGDCRGMWHVVCA